VMVRTLPPASIQNGGSINFSSTSDPTTHFSDGQSYIDYYHLHMNDEFLSRVRKSGI